MKTITRLTKDQLYYWGNIIGSQVEVVFEMPWSAGVDVKVVLPNGKTVFIDKSQLS